MKKWQQRMLQVVWIVLLVAGIIGMLPVLGSIAGEILNIIVRNEFVAFVMGVVLAILGVLVCVASHKFVEEESVDEEVDAEEESDDEVAEADSSEQMESPTEKVEEHAKANIPEKNGGWPEF